MTRTLSMIRGLFDFDGVNLSSMGMERFWHPNMMWYGPCGIGSTRTIAGFQKVTGGTQTTLAIKLNNWTMTATTGRIKTIVRYT
jgi:hypothetical protein